MIFTCEVKTPDIKVVANLTLQQLLFIFYPKGFLLVSFFYLQNRQEIAANKANYFQIVLMKIYQIQENPRKLSLY